MPNLASAKKELRKSVKRNERNRKVKEGLKKMTKQSLKAIAAKEEKAKQLVHKTLKALDKAAQKKVIKKNTSNRKKSRLHLKLNAMNKK
jgi:small subunit ribosomal protein S20